MSIISISIFKVRENEMEMISFFFPLLYINKARQAIGSNWLNKSLYFRMYQTYRIGKSSVFLSNVFNSSWLTDNNEPFKFNSRVNKCINKINKFQSFRC